MLHRYASPLFLGALIVFFPLAVSAEDRDEEAYEEMLDLSNAAADAVGEGHFELGAIKFRQAYATYPDPILLNNEMIAWYRADDCRSALPPARQFMASEGLEPEDRGDVEAVQIQCHLKLAGEALDEEDAMLASHHLDALEALPLEGEDQESYQSFRHRLDEQSPSVDHDATAYEELEIDDRSSNSLTWAQISGGIAVTGVGLALHSVALSRQSQLRELADAGDAERLGERQESWGSYQSTARWAVPTMYTVGGLAIGSGIFLLMRDQTLADLFALTPSISDERVGVSLFRRF